MVDREIVIKGLEHCYFGGSGTCYEKECPYYQSHDCTDELKNDILVLLKEQEPVRPVLARIGNYAAINDYTCPVCGTDLYHLQKYCDECGRAVKWG